MSRSRSASTKGGHQPIFIADLQGKPVSLGDFFKKRHETREEFVHACKRFLIEISELEEQRPEFFAEAIHRFEEKMEILVAVHQRLLVGDDLRHFCRKQKSRRSFRVPALYGGNGGSPVKRVVQFHGIELGGVVAEELRGFHPCGIEDAFPPSCGERGRTQSNLGFGSHGPRF